MSSSDDRSTAVLRFDVVAGADARGAHLDSLGLAVDLNADILDVRLEGTFVGFHNVQTDPAFFLGQTTTDDMTAFKLLFSANTANIAHCEPHFPQTIPEPAARSVIYNLTNKYKKNGGLTGTRTRDHRLKRAMLYRLSYQPAVFFLPPEQATET